ncbi:PII uridylyl-transferase [[Haemophilus] ducreyi]|nr:PII uridylyl-transferase [[Haemophilus] ducreyi]
MRFALHLQLKRYDNRLYFDRQLCLSKQLGYQGEGNQPVETMMRHYFQATQSISQLSQLLIDNFQLSDRNPHHLAEKQALDSYFYLQGHQLNCQNRRCFTQQPSTILDLFYYLTEYPNVKIDAKTLRYLRLALQKLTEPLCQNPMARKRFIALFSQPNVIARAIVPMHQLGVLSAYFPQWQAIVGLMQFDLFHLYTVDEHTIRVMQKLESFLAPQTAEDYPLCCQLFQQSDHKPILYLAALFHDIAKGRKGEHTNLGAEEIYQFALLHDFSAQQAQQMAWLVQQHLTMSITAQRRDIHDSSVVQHFAKIVGNSTALADLMCLTIADICATNANLWNNWKRTLFSQLYQFTLKELDRSLDYQYVSQAHRAEAFALLNAHLSIMEQQKLHAFWQPCPKSYFLRNTPTQLVWHAQAFIQKAENEPLVLVSNQYARGATEIFVHCSDQPQLFAHIAQVLSRKKISIHDAQIMTSKDKKVFDSFIVTEVHGSALTENRCREIKRALLEMLLNNKSRIFKLIKKPVKHQSFSANTKVSFLVDTQPQQTSFELFTLDREGLLAQVSAIFNQLDLVLINAKITTIGERVEDLFVVTTKQNTALTTQQKKQLKCSLLTELAH